MRTTAIVGEQIVIGLLATAWISLWMFSPKGTTMKAIAPVILISVLSCVCNAAEDDKGWIGLFYCRKIRLDSL